MSQTEADSVTANRRTQVRIEVQIPVKVTLPGEVEPVTAMNQDISWGGALLLIAEPLPKVAGNLRIVYPWKQGQTISAEARLLRARPLADGRYLIAVRFTSLSPRSQSRLVKLLTMLKSGQHALDYDDTDNLVRELEVIVNDADELRNMLKQIAKGHHTVTVFDAYEPNQSISLSIVGTRDLPGIRLRARVVHVQKTDAKIYEWTSLYTLLLDFEHPKRAIKSFVKLLLEQLPAARRPVGWGGEAPDWLRSNPLARPTSADRARASGGRILLSTLETDFPEALNRLTAGWGDIDAFEVLFRDLVLGEHGQPGGWPADAWAELELLQDVHDRCYGMSASRKSLLKSGRKV